MSSLAIESERRLLSCLDEVLDAPPAERRALIRSRFGSDEKLMRELEQLIVEAERNDATFLAQSVDAALRPVVADLSDHAVTQGEMPAALTSALAPRYAVLERIGRGGMASVYLAYDSTLGRHVAVKTLRPELADGISLERFEREIAIATTVDHPRIMPVYDRGNAGGILYYVMRYVEGGSLRDLLSERPQLEIRKAIDIARDVAEALDAAHAKKVVHRDIKPANILLDEGGAHVADFGVAGLMDAVGPERLTRSGVALGTTLYMSPEQAGSSARVDGRSDVYSLGCVLYEMLAGEPPFTGPTQRDIIAKHLAAAVPDLTVVRATITRPMQQVIATALQKSPADRFASAGEFIDAFERAYLTPEDAPANQRANRPPGVVTLATLAGSVRPRRAVLLTAGLLLVGLGGWRLSVGMRATTADPTLHVVFPFDATGDAPFDAAQRLREAIGKWVGIRVVDHFTLGGELGVSGAAGLNQRRTAKAVRSLGAGRFIRGRVQAEGEVFRIVATLFDVDSGQLAEVSARLRRDLSDADSAMGTLAERLLFYELLTARDSSTSSGTSVFRARYSYLTAHDAIRQWELARADSALFRATELDGGYSQALLWLAQVRFWREEPASRWRDYVERAVVGGLSDRDRAVALSLKQWADDNVVESCASWERLAAAAQHDGLFWYSAHKCRFRDEVVVPDPRSPTGWQFRSSHHLALAHMERALRLNPAIYRGLRENGFEQLRSVLKTNAGQLRRGRREGEQGYGFGAYPMLSADTLAFVPIPVSQMGIQVDAARQFRPMITRALQRQRQVFREWATTWTSNYPQSAEAWEAVAVALETLGDASALDTIARARQLARSPGDLQRISGTQAWLLVKFSLPSDLAGLRRARLLIDSVLRRADASRGDQQLLVSLAALTGRLSLAVEHARFLPDWPRTDAPASVNQRGAQLLLHAALGSSSPDVTTLERSVDSLISLELDDPIRGAVRSSIIVRSALLAFPSQMLSALSDSTLGNDWLLQSVRQWRGGDRKSVAATLGTLRQSRTSIEPANLQFDRLLPEARLVELIDGTSAAARWIDPTLAAVRGGSHQNLLDPVRAASLVGTMTLRADLASRARDYTTAAMWAGAVAELLENSERFMRPTLERMRSLTR